MPMITVQYSSPKAQPGLQAAVAAAVNTLSATILRKNPAVTAVAVEEIAPGHWFIGNKSLVQHQLAAFWLDIRVVDSTNTREEKADFIAAAFAKMSELLGPLH